MSGGAVSALGNQEFMARALRLARRGEGRVSPNPMVGAVVVKNGRIVGQGYHEGLGRPHAETVALEDAGKRSEGADLYVNLEPCCHHGRTPPCTDAIIERSVRRVWVAIRDPNPLVDGKGLRALGRRGVSVSVGLLAQRAAELNEVYLTYVRTGRPFVVAKSATTLDGRIATSAGESRWISGPDSRRLAHRLRQRVDAVVVGVDTVNADDPRLTVRMGTRRPRHPVRIVLDTSLRVAREARVLSEISEARTVVACGRSADRGRIARLRARGVDVWPLATGPEGRVSLKAMLRRAAREGMTSILIEGGGQVLASALDAGVVDKLVVFLAPKILGADARAGVGDLGIGTLDEAVSLCDVRWRRVGQDFMVEGYPVRGRGGTRCSRDWWKRLGESSA